MTRARLNLACSLCSAAGAVLLAAFVDPASGVVWLGASLVWAWMAARSQGASGLEPHPFRRIGRRLSRLLIWS